MIGWAPLEPINAPAPIKLPIVSPHKKQKSFFDGTTETECNYLVLFFIVGVLGLAVKDMLNK
jgi:hypothetical protein